MQNYNPAIHFASHVGPFSLYPTAAYAITIATSPDKLGMPKWPNNIPTRAPDAAPDDYAVAALHTTVAQHGRAILLFADHTRFKGWQLLLAQVLA